MYLRLQPLDPGQRAVLGKWSLNNISGQNRLAQGFETLETGRLDLALVPYPVRAGLAGPPLPTQRCGGSRLFLWSLRLGQIGKKWAKKRFDDALSDAKIVLVLPSSFPFLVPLSAAELHLIKGAQEFARDHQSA